MKPFKIKKNERNISVRMPEIRKRLTPPKLPKKIFTKNIHKPSQIDEKNYLDFLDFNSNGPTS